MHDPVADLERLANALPNDGVLLIAPPEHALSLKLKSSGGPNARDASSLFTSPPDKRYQMAILAGYLDTLQPKTGERLIAALRDLYAESLYCLASPTLWPAMKMAALGLRPLGFYPDHTDQLALYYFDLYDYKRTPDWLNAKFWAHPERWGKAHW